MTRRGPGRVLRDWAPRRGAKIGPVPEWTGFLVAVIFAVALVAAAVLLF